VNKNTPKKRGMTKIWTKKRIESLKRMSPSDYNKYIASLPLGFDGTRDAPDYKHRLPARFRPKKARAEADE
jgi:hypothetical protein